MVKCNACGWVAPEGVNARDIWMHHDRELCRLNNRDKDVSLRVCEVCGRRTKFVRGFCMECPL